MTRPPVALLATLLLFLIPLTGCQTESVVSRSCDAAEVMRQFSLGGHPIPSAELASAKGVAIIKETEGGVIVGGRGGKGVLVRRTTDGKWSAPLAVDSGGLSVGLQVGLQGSGVVLVFQSDVAVDQAINAGDFSANEAEGSLGPWGGGLRDAGGGVKVYTRSGGLYGGATLGNMKLTVNHESNALTYGHSASVENILAGQTPRPLGTGQLYKLLPETGPVRTAGSTGGSGRTASEE
jgi:lipid-binding SYLF domain-containing protein